MKTLKIFFYILTVIILQSCASIYTPSTPNVPLFKNKNQGQVEATLFANGLNLKTAYTPVKHFAFQINAQAYQEFDRKNPDRKFHKYLEGAFGSYYSFNDKFVVELYVGYGKGASTFGDGLFSNETLLTRAKGYYDKYYLQLNLATIKLLKKGTLGICIRYGNVRYLVQMPILDGL